MLRNPRRGSKFVRSISLQIVKRSAEDRKDSEGRGVWEVISQPAERFSCFTTKRRCMIRFLIDG
jgi:hypothetical protein